MNQNQKIILVLSGILTFLLAALVYSSKRAEQYNIGAALSAACDTQVNQACKADYEAAQKASPSEYPALQFKYKQCLKGAYNKCACSGETKTKILDQCFESLRNTKAFEAGSRTFGCYALKNPADKRACFENPYKYLCAQPDSMACQEIKQLCDLSAVCPDA